MAITVDNTAIESGTNFNFANTGKVSGENCIVVCITVVSGSDTTLNDVKYNTVAMTRQSSNQQTGWATYIYTLTNASAGTNLLQIFPFAAPASDWTIAAAAINGVDESDLIEDADNTYTFGSPSATLSMTVESAGIMVDSVIMNGDITSPATPLIGKIDNGTWEAGAHYASSGTSSYTSSDAGGHIALAAITINPEPKAPTVSTGTSLEDLFENIGTISESNVTDGGTETVTERGVVIDTSSSPTISDTKFTATGTTGSYDIDMTSLTAGTLYYARAFATNSIGTSYGTQITFITDEDASKKITILDNPITYS